MLDQKDAILEIPHEVDDLYVVIDGKTLPIESLGSGVHEIVILAAAVTLVDDAVFCIEEPEVHCHPQLQKQFMRYIGENTNHQYFIASHSNAFFDLPGVNIYRCWMDKGNTKCELASSATDRHAMLFDLGYKPSDLLQANYVIWVEGPSDRIYINHWINAKAPDLCEGMQYSIMFYGGRLLSHLCYDDPDASADIMTGDFVRLSRLNRNTCVVMDSDRDTAEKMLNGTKQRIQKEFEDNSCLVWITSGRTIENYIPEEIFDEAVSSVHPRRKKIIPAWTQFADRTRCDDGTTVDKVAVARNVVERGGLLETRSRLPH